VNAVALTQAASPAHLTAVRALCWDYHSFLLHNSDIDREITQTFYPKPKYEALMQALPQEHARPQGMILLATLNDQPVGCGMTHALTPQTSEIKRVFVSNNARGTGIAAQICAALMDQARTDGFTQMVLDTSITLKGAQRLYTKLGFTPRGPYQPVPPEMLPNLLFYESTL
jgi:GNAT superfamily N-acetyltransferase